MVCAGKGLHMDGFRGPRALPGRPLVTPAASASASRLPRQATSVPPSRQQRCGVLDDDLQRRERASRDEVKRTEADRARTLPGCGRCTRSATSTRPPRASGTSTSAPRSDERDPRLGPRDCQRKSREAGAGPEVRNRVAPRRTGQLEPDQRVCEAIVDRFHPGPGRRSAPAGLSTSSAMTSASSRRTESHRADRSDRRALATRPRVARCGVGRPFGQPYRSEALPLAGDVRRVPTAHGPRTLRGIAIEPTVEFAFEQREDIPHERRPASHPLVIGAATVVVGAVQTRLGESLHQPTEQRLVPHVHPHGDRGCFPSPPNDASPMSRPITRPRSNSESSDMSRVLHGTVSPRKKT